MIQAARNLLTEADGATRRKLRFSPGPVGISKNAADMNAAERNAADWGSAEKHDWLGPITDVRRATDRPIVILVRSQVTANHRRKSGDARCLRRTISPQVQAAADEVGVQVIDVRPELLESAVAGIWPHGFHNGVIGSGHLNATGNRITATGLVDATKAAIEQGN